MITAVDANILIDVLADDPVFAKASVRALRRSASEGRTVVGETVLVEVLTGFADPIVGLEHVAEVGVTFLPMTPGGAVAAAQARQRARKAGAVKDRLLPDFLIGGHAMVEAHRLLTRDVVFYRRWFPGLPVVDPADM